MWKSIFYENLEILLLLFAQIKDEFCDKFKDYKLRWKINKIEKIEILRSDPKWRGHLK
jgi:hypothetical protein